MNNQGKMNEWKLLNRRIQNAEIMSYDSPIKNVKENPAMKKIICFCCKRKRLFDADPSLEGTLQIKCPACKRVNQITFRSGKVYKEICTEQIGA